MPLEERIQLYERLVVNDNNQIEALFAAVSMARSVILHVERLTNHRDTEAAALLLAIAKKELHAVIRSRDERIAELDRMRIKRRRLSGQAGHPSASSPSA